MVAGRRSCQKFPRYQCSKGDRIAILSPNRFEWVVVQYATARIGAILVNINPAYQSSELAYVLKQSGASILVSALSFKETDYKVLTEKARPLILNYKGHNVVLIYPYWLVMKSSSPMNFIGHT